MAYKRNNEGKFVDENGADVFSNDIFNQLVSGEHNYLFTPNSNYVNMQIEKVFIPSPEDARKYVDIVCSKLMDDNGSLASDDKEKELYTKDVKSFMAIVNKVCDSAPEDVKNTILGGTFATKDDADPKYQVPLYLCSEILKAKWNAEYQSSPSETWDDFDTSDEKTVATTSTLGEQMDVVIGKLKTLDYDKDYFSGDMSVDSSNYVAACQFDSTNSIDIYAQCEDNSCDLYATNGQQTYNVTMFNVQKQAELPATGDISLPTTDIALPETTSVDTPVEVAPVAAAPIETPVEVAPVAAAPIETPVETSPVETVIEETPVEIPAETPVNIITDSNDVAQITDISQDGNVNVVQDVLSPSIPLENADVFANVESSPAESEIAGQTTPIEVSSTNDKYQELLRLREEALKAQEALNKALDEYINSQSSISMESSEEKENGISLAA